MGPLRFPFRAACALVLFASIGAQGTPAHAKNYSCSGGVAHVTSLGGRMVGQSVQLVPVLWGPNVASQTASNIQSAMTTYASSPLMTMIRSEYGVPAMPLVEAPFTLTLHFPASKVSPLKDADIQAELNWQIQNGKLPPISSSASYVFLLHFPATITPQASDGTNACTCPAGSGSPCKVWCGYHRPLSSRNANQVTYAIIPDFSSGVCSTSACSSQGPDNFSSLTITESHEIAEALTDPDGVTGFRVRSSKDVGCPPSDNEIGDICSKAGVQIGSSPAVYVQNIWSNKANACVTRPGAVNDLNGVGHSDLILTGGFGWNTIPTAVPSWNGSCGALGNYSGYNNGEISGDTSFPLAASYPLSRAVPGDFDGDGLADLALWTWSSLATTIPVAMASGNAFTGTNGSDGGFQFLTMGQGAWPVAGDFDGDGRSDIAVAGGATWHTIPIAYSAGNGTFTVTNDYDNGFEIFATLSGAHTVSGDFNCDGLGDIAVVGPSSLTFVPIAHSNGDGTFKLSTFSDGGFAQYASKGTVVSGDFNGDCFADIAVVGGPGSNIPIAFNNGDGSFTVSTQGVSYGDTGFYGWARVSQPVSGDYNGDGLSDIALVSTSAANDWNTMPIAFSRGDGTFMVTNGGEACLDNTFPVDATQSWAYPVGP